MSFPGRPPISLSGMPLPPGMLPPPPYAMHPIPPGMMPVPPGLTMVPPPMMAPVTVVTTSSAVLPRRPTISSTPIIIKKPPTSQPSIVPPQQVIVEIPQKHKYEGPPITVFVGNISDRGSDILIRQILQKCGMINSWKRVQGANGKLQAFGFCEYADPDSALRAIRLLHEWELGDKKLVVKVDAKTNSVLDEYKEKKKSETSEKEVEEENRTGDENARSSIDGLIKECFIDLSKPSTEASSFEVNSPTPAPKPPSEPLGGQTRHNNPNLDDIEVDDEKKDLIHREIGKFREFCQKDAETKDKQKEITRERKERDYERERRERDIINPREYDRSRHDNYNKRSRSRSVERERDRDRDSYSSRDRDRNRDRNRDNDRDRNDRNDRGDRNYSRDNRDRSEKMKDSDDEEEDKERRWQERKLREKETSYQERLRYWETRERKKVREYDKEKEREDDKKKEEVKEGKRLKEFLEDYDDERDDPKYYRGSALARRMKDRDREVESDNRDRQKEKDEIDELRRRLADEGYPDPAAEVKRRQQEEEEKMREKLKFESEKKARSSKSKRATTPSPPPPEPTKEEISSSHSSNTVKPPHIIPDPVIDEVDYNTNNLSGFSDTVTTPTNKEEPKSKPIGFTGLKLGSSSPSQANSNVQENGRPHKRKKMSIGEIFSSQDEDTDDNGSRKRKLVPLEYTEEEMKAVGQQSASPNTPSSNSNTEEKRKNIKNLIEKIPTAKDELFEFGIDRTLVDNSLMEKRIKPWVNKKIIEYIGEEEPTLVEFICSKVMAGSAPKSILDDVSMVLDDEAEVFVVKMWRLLIYEIEAKKLGIGK